MRISSLALGGLAALGVFSLAGCGCGAGGDGLAPAAQQQVSDLSSLAKKVNGDYDKLTPDEKNQFLKAQNNDEQAARQLVKMMAHPPNEGMRGPGKK